MATFRLTSLLDSARTPLAVVCLGLAAMGASIPSSAQTLRLAQGTDIDSLDPGITRSTPSHIATTLLFDTLVAWDGPGLNKIVPDLAESWSQSEDGLVWTFKLRQDVKFHDGTPFNADAVKANLDRIRSDELGSPNRSYYALIASVDVIDAHTVALRTRQPSPTLLEILAEHWSGISSPTAIAKHGRAYGRNPVGTGPYRFQQWLPGEQTTLVRNPDYHDKPGHAERIVLRPVPEGQARVIELRTGNTDIASHIPPESANQVKADGNAELMVVPSSFQVFFELNTTKPPFNDVRVRQAVNLAIDRKAIVDRVLNGYGTVPDSPFPQGVQGRRAFEPYPYDPARAKALIEEAFPGGFKEPIVLWTPNGRYMKDRAVAEAVQSYLNAIGLKTEFKSWEWATYQRTLYRDEPGVGTGKGTNAAHMWLLGTGITSADVRVRRKLSTGDASNLTGYSDPEVDRLLASAAQEMDYDKRMALYGEIQRIVWQEKPATVPLFDQVQLIGTRKGVQGITVFGTEVLDLRHASRE